MYGANMKILKQMDIDSWSHTLVCQICDSRLQIDKNDIKCESYPGNARDPSYETYSVTCEVCKTIIMISESKIPKLVKVLLRK